MQARLELSQTRTVARFSVPIARTRTTTRTRGLFHLEVNRQHADGGGKTVETKKFPAAAFEPARQQFQREQAGDEAQNHADESRHKKMQHGILSAQIGR